MLMPEMVRNLDTGELVHMSEIEDRVVQGTQPQSLRPLARPRRRHWLAAMLGLDPASVALEPCLKPLPLLSIGGELLTGKQLRLVTGRDRFRVGDGLARAVAQNVRDLRWRRHRGHADEGTPLMSGSRDETYTPSADDVGCVVTAAWTSPGGLSLRAETAPIQPRPGLRDAVSSLLASGKAAFEVTILHKVTPLPPGHTNPARRLDAKAEGRERRKGSVTLTGSSKLLELAWRSAIGISRSHTKLFNAHTRAVISVIDATAFELQVVSRDPRAAAEQPPRERARPR